MDPPRDGVDHGNDGSALRRDTLPEEMATQNTTSDNVEPTERHGEAPQDPIVTAPSDDGVEEEPDEALTPAVTTPGSVTSPPYWTHNIGHRRSTSNLSAESVLPVGAITMRDNETSGRDERNKACWAKSVEIADHVIVNGSATNIGAFVVWNIRVETLQVRPAAFPHPATAATTNSPAATLPPRSWDVEENNITDS